jgi:hypothetical protein
MFQKRKRPENGTTRSIFHPSIKTSGKLKIMNIQGTEKADCLGEFNDMLSGTRHSRGSKSVDDNISH